MSITLLSFNGINNKAGNENLPDGFMRQMVNFNVDNSGISVQRFGYAKKISGEVTALWSDNIRCFAVIDGNLVEIKNDYTVTTIRASIGRINLDFARVGSNYYYVGNSVNGVIVNNVSRSFGQEIVTQQPRLSEESGGILFAGTYLVAVTLLDDNGVESGTVEPAVITLSQDNKAIRLSNLFLPRDTGRSTYLAIYASSVNGNELYRQGVVPVGTSSVYIGDIDVTTKALDTVGIYPAPYGQLIAYHYQHLFIANGNKLSYCLPKQYERWSKLRSYKYPSRITAICPCESGLWIGTEKDGLFWVMGKQPYQGKDAMGDFSQAKKHHYSCPMIGSARLIPAEYISGGNGQYGYMVTAKDGMILLMDNGQFANVSQPNVTLPDFRVCYSATIKHPNSFNYLAIVSGANVPERSN
jgi:hypothetical protein